LGKQDFGIIQMIQVMNVRGTNGSGKTTLMRRLIMEDKAGGIIRVNKGRTQAHYLPGIRAVVLGTYHPGRSTGGLDMIQSTDEALDAAKDVALNHQPFPLRFLFFEGIICSTVFQTWLDYSLILRRDGDCGMTWAFLHTPVKQCLERIRMRQTAKGKLRPINCGLVEQKYTTIMRIRQKVLDSGESLLDLPQGGEFDVLKGWIAQFCKD
jgi:hypothetical protein